MKDKLLDAARVGREFVASMLHFKGGADRAKIQKTVISNIVTDNIKLGRINLSEAILKAHKENPYKNVDELLGDVQIALTDDYNSLGRIAPHYAKINVEQLIDG